jgi:hypothetical protein
MDDSTPAERPDDRADSGLRAHAAHDGFAKSADTAAGHAGEAARPSKQFHTDAPEVLAKLEALDDAVYEAMGGQGAALPRLEIMWPAVLAELGENLVAESREQYLRYALRIWEQCTDDTGIHDPTRAIAALDVLCVLFDERQE